MSDLFFSQWPFMVITQSGNRINSLITRGMKVCLHLMHRRTRPSARNSAAANLCFCLSGGVQFILTFFLDISKATAAQPEIALVCDSRLQQPHRSMSYLCSCSRLSAYKVNPQKHSWRGIFHQHYTLFFLAKRITCHVTVDVSKVLVEKWSFPPWIPTHQQLVSFADRELCPLGSSSFNNIWAWKVLAFKLPGSLQ